MTNERMTNTEFVTDLMEFSPSGILMQIFIVDALGKWADIVARQPPMEHGLIDGEAWKACAIELRERINQHYGTSS